MTREQEGSAQRFILRFARETAPPARARVDARVLSSTFVFAAPAVSVWLAGPPPPPPAGASALADDRTLRPPHLRLGGESDRPGRNRGVPLCVIRTRQVAPGGAAPRKGKHAASFHATRGHSPPPSSPAPPLRRRRRRSPVARTSVSIILLFLWQCGLERGYEKCWHLASRRPVIPTVPDTIGLQWTNG